MTLALGILCIILKANVIEIGIIIIGVALIVASIIDFVKRRFFSAIVKVILGVLALVIGMRAVEIALLVLGIVLLIYGIIELVKRLTKKKGKPKKAWKRLLIYIQPVFCIIASIVLLTNASAALDWVVIIAGVLFIIDGVLGIINALASKKK